MGLELPYTRPPSLKAGGYGRSREPREPNRTRETPSLKAGGYGWRLGTTTAA